MGKMMNSKNHFKEGIRQQKLEIPYDPYYAEIWGKVTAVSHLSIHSYYFLTPLPPKNTSDRNEAAHEGLDELAGILCSFPRYFEEKSSFGPRCLGSYWAGRLKNAYRHTNRKRGSRTLTAQGCILLPFTIIYTQLPNGLNKGKVRPLISFPEKPLIPQRIYATIGLPP